jgi:hypothetical protein
MKEMDKQVDMELYVDRPGFFHTNISLHKFSPRTEKPIKKPEKTFHIALEPKVADYKEVIDYIKYHNINVVNKEMFKWLK